MNKLIASIVLLLSSIPANFGAGKIEHFAGQILGIIKYNDHQGLKKLSCYPRQDHCVSNEAIKYVFGDKTNIGKITSVLNTKDIKTKIFGPFTYEDKLPNSSYAIVYYIPSLVQFTKNGYMDSDTREKQWNKGYVETLVTVINGRPHLHRTIFYYGAHLPWVGAYG